MNPYNNKKFKDLKKKWYKKLKNDGFEDAEDDENTLKRWHSFYFICRYDSQTFNAKAQYYVEASRFNEHYEFNSEKEKNVWSLHTQGSSVRQIAKELKIKTCQVQIIITNLRKIMLTTIR